MCYIIVNKRLFSLFFLIPPDSEPLLEFVNAFIAKERESGRLDELGEIYLRGHRP